jgi:L-ascorbate 6-phosphate lactonase
MSTPAPLADRIAAARPAADTVAAWWLGGSGFIFKTPAGRQIWIDPYLSDAAQALFGIGRAFPPPITVAEAAPDVIVSTHWHEDHLDPGSIPDMARHRPQARFIMPPSAMARALSWGLARSQITPIVRGETLDLGHLKLTGTFARHEVTVAGWEVPDAVGILFDFEGLRIFHTGDTEYDARIHRAVTGIPLALATLCINGSGGNMNAHEAALMAWHLDARALVPHHHHIWAKDRPAPGETLDPLLFADTYRKLGGGATVMIPTVGAGFTVSSSAGIS